MHLVLGFILTVVSLPHIVFVVANDSGEDDFTINIRQTNTLIDLDHDLDQLLTRGPRDGDFLNTGVEAVKTGLPWIANHANLPNARHGFALSVAGKIAESIPSPNELAAQKARLKETPAGQRVKETWKKEHEAEKEHHAERQAYLQECSGKGKECLGVMQRQRAKSTSQHPVQGAIDVCTGKGPGCHDGLKQKMQGASQHPVQDAIDECLGKGPACEATKRKKQQSNSQLSGLGAAKDKPNVPPKPSRLSLPDPGKRPVSPPIAKPSTSTTTGASTKQYDLHRSKTVPIQSTGSKENISGLKKAKTLPVVPKKPDSLRSKNPSTTQSTEAPGSPMRAPVRADSMPTSSSTPKQLSVGVNRAKTMPLKPKKPESMRKLQIKQRSILRRRMLEVLLEDDDLWEW